MAEEYWLENRPRRSRTRRVRARRSSTRKRRPPKGFRTWKAYMDSIRPGSKRSTGGKTMARRRRRRRRAVAANPRRRRRSTRRVRRNPPVFLANRRRRRHVRRRYRRNPSVRGITGRVFGLGKTAAGIVAGKIVTRTIRGYVPGVVGGTTMGLLTEVAIATLIGMFGSRFLGSKIATDMAIGGYVSAIEGFVKATNVPFAAAALGDDGMTIRVPVSALRRAGVPLNGYPRSVPRSRTLAGYPRTARLAVPAYPGRPGALVPELNDVMA
jgi:hypothetical protein